MGLAVYGVLHEDHYLSTPSSTAQWQQLAAELEIKWQFPHAVGVIMMESNINIKAPPSSGSECFNWKKKQFSIHNFAGYYRCKCKIYCIKGHLEASQMVVCLQMKVYCVGNTCKPHNCPIPCHLGNRLLDVPVFLLCDEAFALDEHFMK